MPEAEHETNTVGHLQEKSLAGLYRTPALKYG